MNSFTKFISIFLSGCLFIIFWILICGWIVMELWNWIMPNVFDGVHEIDIWQSYGLMLISTLLFRTGINIHNKQ